MIDTYLWSCGTEQGPARFCLRFQASSGEQGTGRFLWPKGTTQVPDAKQLSLEVARSYFSFFFCFLFSVFFFQINPQLSWSSLYKNFVLSVHCLKALRSPLLPQIITKHGTLFLPVGCLSCCFSLHTSYFSASSAGSMCPVLRGPYSSFPPHAFTGCFHCPCSWSLTWLFD